MAQIVVKLDTNFNSCQSISDKIAKVDAIINSLLNTALIAVGKGDTVSYSLDDGQTRISKTYTDMRSVTSAIKQYEEIKQMYEVLLNNQKYGRVVKLVDEKSIRNGRIY